MTKPKIILVHGMGSSTSESFKKEFEDACTASFALYPNYVSKKPKDYADIISIGYNDIFDQYREQMSDESKPLLDRLKAIGIEDGGDLSDIGNQVAEIQTKINNDEFFYTHFLDVILYRFTTLGENVRIRVGKEISKAVHKVGGMNVHVIGHSLGTSVAHDTLTKLYDDNYKLGNAKNLSVVIHKLGSLHMVANTSRVLESFIKVRDSLTKPGKGGCVRRYYEYRHLLDPFTWVRPFNPTNNGTWISHDDMLFKMYELSRINSITSTEGDTHAFPHYFFNPEVHRKVFEYALGIKLDSDEIQEGETAYSERTLGGVADDLQDALDGINFDDPNSITALYEAYLALRAFIENLGGQYDFH